MGINGKTNLIVSTCIEESWNVKSRHFFLGEWCRTLNNDKRFIKYIQSKFSHRIVKEFKEVIRT